MKSIRLIAYLAAFLLLLQNATSQEINYSASWSAPGITLVDQSEQGIAVNFSIQKMYFEEMEVNKEKMTNITLPEVFLPNETGAPNLPALSRMVAVPQGASVKLTILSYRTETYGDINVAPAPDIPLDTEKGPLKFEKDSKIYSRNAFYPQEIAITSGVTQLRGVDVVMLGITPFQYNPVTKELIVYRDIKVEIEFTGGNGQFGENRLRSRWWDPILEDALINYSSLPLIDYHKQLKDAKDGYEYLIIIPTGAEFAQWADSLKKFRTEQGILTGVVNTTIVGGNTVTAIENYVNNAYSSWSVPPAAVLLMADYGSTAASTIISHLYSHPAGYPSFASDNKYADVNNDELPDIAFSRMAANNASQLQIMVSKVLNYERNPPTDVNFYKYPITALGWQTERWFQICSEVVGGFWKNTFGKTPVRINEIYSGTPGSVWSTATNTTTVVNYFGPSGLGYIPASPSTLGGWSGGTATHVNNAINNGAFMLMHRDHGYYQGWGEPAYSTTNINSLTNVNNRLPFVLTINCQTGAYHNPDGNSDIFIEKFHRYTYNGQNSGALGLLGPTEVSYSFVNDTYVWGVMDNFWPQFMPAQSTNPPSRDVRPAFGNSAGKIFLYNSAWPYNTGDKLVTYRLFHHHGDAFMWVYSEVPQTLTVVHDPVMISGTTSFSVTANQGSFIALSAGGVILGTATGTGSPVAITIPSQNPGVVVKVVVTKQNYLRYESNVSVIPASGPNVVYFSHTINDAAGNNNSLLDYGESVLLNMTLKNLGTQVANNVTAILSTTDPYITITDNSAAFGNIAAGATSTVNGAFAFTTANNIPDNHVVAFNLQSNADVTWNSNFSITAHAPVLTYNSYSISDPGGNNNGKLDPGETVTVAITAGNSGSSGATNVTGTLSSTDPYIVINTASQNYGTLAAGATGVKNYTVTALSNTPAGHIAVFNFALAANLGITGSGSFNVTIGQIPVLIVDLDGNHNSGPAMQTAIQALGIGVDYTTTFPSNPGLYSSLFVCLGIYSNNHVLTSAEGTTLANYLNAGGMLYMEGGDTWAYDAQTAVHPLFNIDGLLDGSGDMGTILGQASTFTQGMTFTYAGDNSWMDHLGPLSTAFNIFMNQTPSYVSAIAYLAPAYKTIGASFEFGGLTDGTTPSTKVDLMREYLDFFGLLPPPVPPAPDVNVKVYLEGPFSGTSMNKFLNMYGYIPLSQPYSGAPWYYTGTESVTSIPSPEIVDWVLVEFRDAASAPAATSATVIEREAAFLMSDGTIKGTDGTSAVKLNATPAQNLYVVVKQRNHLAVMSANPLVLSGGSYTYDFSTASAQAYNNTLGYKQIVTGIWGMISGDGDSDGSVGNGDKIEVWRAQTGQAGYLNGDFNLSGNVDNTDRITYWYPNAGKSSQVPN